MKHIPHLSLLVILISAHMLYSLEIIRGDATTFPYEFTAPITATALQKSTGTFFVGVAAPTDDPTFSIAKALRPNFVSKPQFIGIATDSNVQGTTIEFLTVSDQATGNSIVPFVISPTDIAFQANQVSAIFGDGSAFTQTTTLNDAVGDTTAGIVQIATSMALTTTGVRQPIKSVSDVFAAVRPSTGDFGNVNSGIALMNLASTSTAIIFNTLDAGTGQPGNQAQFLDASSTELSGDNGGGPVAFSTDTEDVNQVALYYDDPFERLYIGVRIATGTDVNDIAKSVVVGYVNDDNALVLEPIVSDNAIDPTGTVPQIVVAENSAAGVGPNLRANYLGVMHTSAGPSYLIVQGGDGQTNQIGNLIFALPLVDDPSDEAIHGTLADKNAELDDFKFTEPAENPDELATANDPAAQVGAGPLPILPSDQISSMIVEGDAIYISIGLEPTPTNDSGIIYSQALFAADGKIIDWTPWTKRASPIDLFPQLNEITSAVDFFAVDASTGNIYIVQTDESEALVGITVWTEQVSTSTALGTALINELNDELNLGCYSALDLPQSVRGFTGPDATLSRYALFGGVNIVVFTRISEAYDEDIDSPQNVINDFEDPTNFLVTKLPPSAGCVQVLEYSRQTSEEGDTNYFFAGTDNGLFAFADAQGNGFNVDLLQTFTQPPFTTNRWQKIPEITGSVIDIKSSGLALYILTFETSAEMPLKNTLYAVSFEPTLEEMFRPFVLPCMNVRTIAQTGTNPVFGTTQLFTGIQIIATGDPADVEVTADKEQLILATNQGLYKSNANQTGANRGIACADDQLGAQWEIIPTTTNVMYTGISGIETPIRHTTWPISVRDKNDCYSFDASSVEQLSGNGDPTIADDTGEVNFAPIFFDADVDTPAFNTLEPITYFFSDGGRRFFIINPTSISSTRTKLSVIPFDTQVWQVKAPHILKYPALQAIQRFFWVETIGMSGVVLAGTNRGVIGLT